MSRSTDLHLPNGSTFVVTPIYGGFNFKRKDVCANTSLPQGWSIVINTERAVQGTSSSGRGRASSPFFALPDDDASPRIRSPNSPCSRSSTPRANGSETHSRFTKPTLNRDSLFISSISLPSNVDFDPPLSPSRQIAMMIWATMWWYFHLKEPDTHVFTHQSSLTPGPGRPKADWRIYIQQEGVLKGRNLIQKLERMGIVVTEDSSVGLTGCSCDVFVSRRIFWQLDPRIFLFKPKPSSNARLTVSIGRTPQRPGKEGYSSHAGILADTPTNLSNPFFSTSYLPTYYPPPPPLYTFTGGIQHPIRQKPPRQGEVFYTRHIPSLGQTLSFRVPSLPPTTSPLLDVEGKRRSSSSSVSLPIAQTFADNPDGRADRSNSNVPINDGVGESDVDILHRWMNNPRVNSAWGLGGTSSTQEQFLRKKLCDNHMFPCYGYWDGKPFGYFEIYWLKEDRLSRLLPGPVDNWDRGIRALIGEDDCTGEHRMQVWLSALVHYCWLSDSRTQTVVSEPRVDNTK